MSWEERGIGLLCALGMGGVIYVAVMIWKARAWLQESSVACLGYLQQALFHLSFVLVGPLIWLMSRHCPPELPSLIYFGLATLWPVFATGRGLLRHHTEKEDKAKNDEEAQKEAQKSRKWWHFKLIKFPGLKEEFRMSSELEEEMCFWLSYWSCWPLLGAIQVSMDTLTDQSAAGSSGLLIAFTLWLQYWRGCFLAPYVFRMLTHLFSCCIEHASGALDAVRQVVFGLMQRLPWHSYFLSVLQGDTVLLAVVGVLLVLLCLEVASVVSVLITVVLLFSISMESARCVANENQQMYADRLAFWVLVTTWLWVLQIPAVGRILSIWSPLAFGAAFFGGETAFLAIFFAVLHAITAVLSCLNSFFQRQLESQKADTQTEAMKEPLLDEEASRDQAVDLEANLSQTASRQNSSESKGSKVSEAQHEPHEFQAESLDELHEVHEPRDKEPQEPQEPQEHQAPHEPQEPQERQELQEPQEPLEPIEPVEPREASEQQEKPHLPSTDERREPQFDVEQPELGETMERLEVGHVDASASHLAEGPREDAEPKEPDEVHTEQGEIGKTDAEHFPDGHELVQNLEPETVETSEGQTQHEKTHEIPGPEAVEDGIAETRVEEGIEESIEKPEMCEGENQTTTLNSVEETEPSAPGEQHQDAVLRERQESAAAENPGGSVSDDEIRHSQLGTGEEIAIHREVAEVSDSLDQTTKVPDEGAPLDSCEPSASEEQKGPIRIRDICCADSCEAETIRQDQHIETTVSFGPGL